MFLLKKFLTPLILPPMLIFSLLVTGIALLFACKKKNTGKYVIILATAFYGFLSSGPVSFWMACPLENKYSPPRIDEMRNLQTIVVLSGGLWLHAGRPVTSQVTRASAFRLLEAARLYHLLDRPRIVLSSGISNPFISKEPEAKILSDLLVALGIPREALVLECVSRDTHENIREIQRIVGDGAFLLVTSAIHMPRAMGVLEKMKMKAIPMPCGYRTGRGINPPYGFFDLLPSLRNFSTSNEAIYEYTALVWYKIRGYS